ncbi:hypothetical protein B0A68_13315 [Flavobacterium reichenbachii]|uniref:Uncharacterized protein n=1 Tax=Flavobacterium reichenbachii TaxID=362418 RepID=A0A085ZSZ0_9FLAO|nr:hypothetical protein IW19_19500 [Flavobacterium reichenbachii]OXB14197.1 hypothetical protein B0A68_13315 [Flavobacterium reichenbachii]
MAILLQMDYLGLHFVWFDSGFSNYFTRLVFGRKFGNQKVNKVQFYFLGFIILLWIIRAIANL